MQDHSTTEQAPLCLCGCGQPVSKGSRGRYWQLYRPGHNAHRPKVVLNEVRYCACGCGTVLDLSIGSLCNRLSKRYAPFHGSRSRTSIENFWRRVQKTEGCWLWTKTKGSRGRGSLSYAGKRYSPHQFSYVLHLGPIPHGMEVCHTCDVVACVNPEHLFTATHADNIRDMIAKGRHWQNVRPAKVLRGSRHPGAKLTDEQVRQIRETFRHGLASEFADRYHVSQGSVRNIVFQRTWRHLT